MTTCYVLCCYVVMLLCVMCYVLCCYVFKGAGGYLILWAESLGGYFSKKLVKKYYL